MVAASKFDGEMGVRSIAQFGGDFDSAEAGVDEDAPGVGGEGPRGGGAGEVACGSGEVAVFEVVHAGALMDASDGASFESAGGVEVMVEAVVVDEEAEHGAAVLGWVVPVGGTGALLDEAIGENDGMELSE